MDKVKKNSTLVNIQGLSLFLEEYKKKILDENSPIISELNIKIDEFTVDEESKDIRLYSHNFQDTFKTELQNIDIEKEVLINCEPQDIELSNFSLLNTNLFNIEKKKTNIIISKFAEEEIVNYSNWYVLKLNPYFLLLSIDRIKEKLLAPHRFSTIDKYILGIKEIIEEGKSEINLDDFNDFTQKLDRTQKQAFSEMVNSKNLALIKGPPGTGKTTVIEHFLEYSLRTDPKRRIIFATNLHSSMDSIIDKVNNNKFLRTKKILRLTKKPHSRRTAKHKILNISKLADVYITTLASQRMNTVLLEKSFWFNNLKPILIIDEASATNILSILSNTANIEKIIVIGDDQQLSPIYDWQYYNHFKDSGFDKEFRFFFVISFFNFIYNKNKNKSIFLTNNYRSAPQIVNFINNFYENKLKAKKTQSTLSFEIIRSGSYEKSKNAFQFLMNNKNLTIRNTIFMCEYKKVIKDLHLFLDKKIFNTTTSIQGNEADNICIFLTRNIGTYDYNSQLDYRTVNVAFSRARKKVYIFSYDGIVDMNLIDKSNKWKKIKINNSYTSISKLISTS